MTIVKTSCDKIHFNFIEDHEIDDYNSISGAARYTFPRDVIVKALEYCEEEDIKTFMVEELKDENYVDEDIETVTLESVDVSIGLCEFIMSGAYKTEHPVSIDVYYENIIWLFHDISHMIYDFDDFDVWIDGNTEIRAIEDSIKQLIASSIPIPYDILSTSNREFESRFNSPVDFIAFANHHGGKPALPDTITVEI